MSVRQAFWFLDEVVGDLRIHVRAYVRAYVRPYVTLLLENRSLLFSETLQLIRAFNSEKNVPNAFSEKIPFCPFWLKIVQNWPFGWMCATVSLRAGNP